jgi:hypothetical protein
MHVLLALMLITVCVVLVARAVWRPTPISAFCATLGLFSIGYYGLPMLLIERSTLRYLPESEISATIGMALLFLISLIAGVAAFSRGGPKGGGFRVPVLDGLIERHWWKAAIISNLIVWANNGLRTVTFYQVESVDEYIAGRSAIEGVLGFASGLAQALSALLLVMALQARKSNRIAFAVLALATQMAIVFNAGQRLILIFPILLVVSVMVARRTFRLAGATLAAGIGFLMVISPFAVAIRAGSWNSQQDVQAESFSYGEDPFDTMLQSIVDRGDILQNMATLKAHVDANGRVGPLYYWSVAAIPIPRLIYPGKPYVLSDTGNMRGEASVLAWNLTMGSNTGSLTAFGSVIAYREGGWAWIPVNGLLAGMLIAWLLTWFQRGGLLSQAFFAMAFVNWSIRKVPPSLFEVMVDVMTYLPVLAVLYVLNRIVEGERWEASPAAASPPAPA